MLSVLSLIINVIFILFPNLLYIIYVANKHNLKESINKIVLDISILFSLLLIIIYNRYFFINNIIIYPIILLLFALYKKRITCALILSIISFEFINIFYDFNIYIIISLFLGYFVIYALFNKNNNLFMLIYYVYSVITIYIAFHLKGDFSYTNYILNIVLFSLIIFLLNMWIKRVEKILELQNILKEYQNEKKLRESLFKITHEIKNPLAVVKGYLSMLNLNNKETSIKYVSIINSEVERTINLLQDFMQFSKIEIDSKQLNFNDLLDEIKSIVTPLFVAKNILYEFKSENNLIINGDYNRLKQVIINLIKNSIEASSELSKVYITVFMNKRHLNIVVKDNGIGMSKETLDNLFIPFYTTKDNGTGLGICLSKEIIEAHKGKIIYTSYINKGTTAKIVLPIN